MYSPHYTTCIYIYTILFACANLPCTIRPHCSRQDEAATREALVSPPVSLNEASDVGQRQSVYNATTVPLMRPQGFTVAKPNNGVPNSNGTDDDNNGDPNELGIPRASIHRWLPSSQRGLLQRQAELFARPKSTMATNNNAVKTETDIF